VTYVKGTVSVFDYVYQRIFNLPMDANVTIAVRTLSMPSNVVGSNGAFILPANFGAGWHIAISGENQTFTARVYVFVHAKDIIKPKYGIAAFNQSGQIIFHNRRPAMAYKEMFYTNFDNTFIQSSVAVAYKPATVVWSLKVQPYNVGYYRYFPSAHSLNGGYGVGITRNYSRAAAYEYQLTNLFYYPVIDGGFFEQFPNLGNYPQ
jgi:hypothetical protein